MNIFNTISEYQQYIHHHSNIANSIALVPTMGNLHRGHLELIKTAKKASENVVVSIFVNPLQFSPDEDFKIYPRTLKQDLNKLEKLGCNLVFAPSINEMYPIGTKDQNELFKIIPPSSIADILEGQYRPGFFIGVATVVLKLFNIIQPKYAVFGKKDFQQLIVIENMVKALNLPINIIRSPTIREDDGLAISSRNSYLSNSNRKKALQLYQTLKNAVEQIKDKSFKQIENDVINHLTNEGWQCDYVTFCRQENLQTPNANDNKLVLLAAAKLDKVRLIDNIEFDRKI